MREGMGARGCSRPARVPITSGFQARTRRASAPKKPRLSRVLAAEPRAESDIVSSTVEVLLRMWGPL